MNTKSRLKNRKGFSLAETLMAVLILMLVSVIVATGAPAAKNAYYNVILGSNAQSLLTTTVAALRDKLGTAWNVSVGTDDETTITYFNADNGAKSMLTVEDKVIYVTDGAGSSVSQKYPLVPTAAASDGTYIIYDGVDASTLETKGVLLIENLRVYSSDETEITGVDELAIRILSAGKETAAVIDLQLDRDADEEPGGEELGGGGD